MTVLARRRGAPTAREAELTVGTAVPGAAVHAAVGVVVAASLLVAWLASEGPSVVAALVCVVLGAVVALVPRVMPAALTIVAVGAVVLLGGPAPVVAVMVLVLLLHLLVWTCSLASRVPWRSRVEVAVLTDGLREVLPVQVGAQVLALVALLLAGADVALADLWRILALVAVAGAVLVVLPRRP